MKFVLVQGRLLPHNISQGVIISNHSLVLQSVSRTTAGNYSCVGYNAEGDGESLPFELNVMCKYFFSPYSVSFHFYFLYIHSDIFCCLIFYKNCCPIHSKTYSSLSYPLLSIIFPTYIFSISPIPVVIQLIW
jgi:hypothetical protein